MRPTKTSVVFAAFATVALAASASRPHPCLGACEAITILPPSPCSWSEHYVNASAASLAAVHVRGLRAPTGSAPASQPESLHCCGFRSPPSPQCIRILRSLMPAAAWEEEEGEGEEASRWHLHCHDVTAVSGFDQDLTVSLPAMAKVSHPPSSLSWMEDPGRHSRGAVDSEGGICLQHSSAAPAMLELAVRRRAELRRSPPSTSSAAHVSPELVLGSHRDTGSSFLGALYASYSVWELASVLCAVAWLLVCLAA